MRQLKFTLLLMTCIIFQYGCTEDSTSDLVGETVDDITYTNTVKNIIETNCIICHSQPPQNGAPMPLTTYEFVKDAVLTKGLMDRISRPQGSPGMMPNGGTRLPQAKIDQVFEWAQNGLPE